VKFISDIDLPYHKLKNIIASERPSKCMALININNRRVSKYGVEDLRRDLICQKQQAQLLPLTWITYSKISYMVNIIYFSRRTFIQLILAFFLLCVFFIASKIFNSQFFTSRMNEITSGLLIGSIMPLIPSLISYLTVSENGIDSTIFKERVRSAIEQLEHLEEKRLENDPRFNHKIPFYLLPYKYVIVSVARDYDMTDTPTYDEPNATLKPIKKKHMELDQESEQTPLLQVNESSLNSL
jgi:hypothetical protein